MLVLLLGEKSGTHRYLSLNAPMFWQEDWSGQHDRHPRVDEGLARRKPQRAKGRKEDEKLRQEE